MRRTILSCPESLKFCPVPNFLRNVRTTTIIERLSREWKQEKNSMESAAKEHSYYSLSGSFWYNPESHHKANPAGKVDTILPFFYADWPKKYLRRIIECTAPHITDNIV